MDTLFVSVFILFAAATELIMLRPAGAFRDEAADEKMFKRASLSDSISVHARGRGNPYISLSDVRDVITAYDGPPDLVEAMEQNRANPLSLASADFDEDGVPDLVSGYGGPDGGIITVQRGNIDSIHPNTLEAKRRRAEGDFTESPFLFPARTFYVPETAEFIVAGDFDADGHFDVAVASRGSKGLVLLPGDGRAGFGEARKIDLPGAVTALTSGDINRRDGLIDIVVAVAADDGPEALIFEGPRGASNAKPEIIPLPDAATLLAIGQLDGEYPIDIAVAAGSGLVIRHGRDRRLSLDEVRQGGVSEPVTRQMSFGFKINSIAVGNFTGRHESSLAMLSSDGTVYLANLNKEVKTHALASVPWLGDAELVCSNVSSGPADDLAVLDRSGKRVHILSSSGPGTGAGNGGSTALPRNVVGNNSEGILILSVLPSSSGNTVQGNHIGIDVTGAMVLFNSSGASVGGENNTVGGTTAGARNLISGNSH